MDYGSASSIRREVRIPGGLRTFIIKNARQILLPTVRRYVQVGYRLPWLEKALKPYSDSNLAMP
jgi:hypothetical protein